MRSPLGLVKTSITVSVFGMLLLTGCDNQSNNDVDAATSEYDADAVADDPSETTGNPCLNPQVIQAMKEKIIGGAINNVENNYTSDTINSSVIYNTDINFNYITQPTSTSDGGWSCGAQVNVTYTADSDLDNDVAVKVVQIMKSNYSHMLPDMGINPYNISDFQDISGNSFSSRIDYEISTTYSESGEEQQSWQASIVDVSNMLALIAVVEDRRQRSRTLEDEYKKRREDEAVKNASYQEEIEANNQDQDQELAEATLADNYYESDTEGSYNEDVSEVDTEEQPYDTAYVYDGENIEQ